MSFQLVDEGLAKSRGLTHTPKSQTLNYNNNNTNNNNIYIIIINHKTRIFNPEVKAVKAKPVHRPLPFEARGVRGRKAPTIGALHNRTGNRYSLFWNGGVVGGCCFMILFEVYGD